MTALPHARQRRSLEHQAGRSVECHYCGFRSRTPTRCTGCDGEYLRLTGYGTERVLGVLEGDRNSGNFNPLHSATISEWELPTEHAVAGSRTLTISVSQN